MKLFYLTLFIFFFSFKFFSQDDNLNNQANTILKTYFEAFSWEERLSTVINPDQVADYMEDRYEDAIFNGLQDTSTYIYALWKTIRSRPLIKHRKVENYFKKTYSVNYNNTNYRGEYLFRLDNGKLLIDWMATQGIGELSLKAFEIKKPVDYVMLRGSIQLDEHKYPEKLPDYFTVKIRSEGSSSYERAVIYKNSENGKKLMDDLFDLKQHKKVFWVKYFNWVSRDNNKYRPLLENVRLIGYINSIESDSYINLNENSRISLESPNLIDDKKQYDLKKTQIIQEEIKKEEERAERDKARKEKEYFSELIKSRTVLPLKVLNSSSVEYFDKVVELYGFLELSDYYNYGYDDKEASHYSFKLKDPDYAVVQIYFLKQNCKPIYELLTSKKKVAVKVKAVAKKYLQEGNWGNILMEGISYEVLEYKE